MLNEKDSSNELDVHGVSNRPSEAGEANEANEDNPCIRNPRPSSAAIGGALGGIGGRRTNRKRLR